ncbi:MAG TPA: GTPase HflX, partial [Gammaproteobacteria bacterium]|nr:GTPase HflX [Gammaproteobacteria bacterium]
RLELEGGTPVVLADTVGFVSRLPHDLVAAFKSTLQETVEADLLLHVIDAASPRRAEQIDEVESVLQQIGAAQLPRLEIYNKVDLLEDAAPRVERDAQGRARAVWLSARTGAGLELLRQVLAERFAEHAVRRRICLGAEQGRLRALLYGQGRVLSEEPDDEGGTCLELELLPHVYERLRKHEPLLASRWPPLAAASPGLTA